MMIIPNQLDLEGERSEVLYMTGLGKSVSEQDVEELLRTSNIPYLECKRDRFRLWVSYESIQLAQQAQFWFHQSECNGCTLMCRFELGFDVETGKRRISRNSIHTTVIRRIQPRKSAHRKNTRTKNKESTIFCCPTCSKPDPTKNLDPNLSPTFDSLNGGGIVASYSYKSLTFGETEYPFPTGLYLSRIIPILQKWPRDDPLVKLVSNTCPNEYHNFGNKYAKELSESMAMVDAVERAMKLVIGKSSAAISAKDNTAMTVRVFCLGDGKVPLTAACMALHFAYPNWEFVSIDPLLQPLDTTAHPKHKLIQFSGKSQDYRIPIPEFDGGDGAKVTSRYLDIVVACHSHAPLQEFWDRLMRLKSSSQALYQYDNNIDDRYRAICIAMPCCADYSQLIQTPLLEFDDFEVYSAKRQVRIYNDEGYSLGS